MGGFVWAFIFFLVLVVVHSLNGNESLCLAAVVNVLRELYVTSMIM